MRSNGDPTAFADPLPTDPASTNPAIPAKALSEDSGNAFRHMGREATTVAPHLELLRIRTEQRIRAEIHIINPQIRSIDIDISSSVSMKGQAI